jgi:nucleoside-diphosphate-sugar epimerase
MSVLLIGGSGYIGSYMAGYLKAQGHKICVYDKVPLKVPNIRYFVEDMRDIDFLTEIVNSYDVIVILAGLVGDKSCMENPSLAYVTNHRTIGQITEKFPDKHIIFMSTCAVYGASGDLLHENSPTSPLSVYAETKLAGERHITSIQGTIFRLGSVYGVGYNGNIRLDSIVNLLVKQAAVKGEVVLFGGKQWKSFISVKDVAAFVDEAIRNDIRGLYNLTDINLQLYQVANKIVELYPHVTIRLADSLANDRDYQIGTLKLMNTFNSRFNSSLEKEIKELWRLFAS